jgi:ribosome biogenesis GTPase
MYLNLKKYGLSDRFEQEASLYDELFLARVLEQHRDLYKVACENGELIAGISGRLSYHADDQMSFPAVGDWVMIDRTDSNSGNAVIKNILGRKSVFVRQAAGTGNGQQVIAANVDTVFICMSLNSDFNLRRIERYLAIAWDSMATPVIILTKADLCNNLEEKIEELSSVSMGIDVIVCSAENENGYQAVNDYIKNGKTTAFIGSSGVGKSTLINRLMGKDIQATQEIRTGDDKGKHTTTYRQLQILPNGGIVIDTPGMRELQLYTGNISKAFEDIEELAEQCKFKNCSHTAEPGCVVRNAIESGILSEHRFENYLKLQREITYEGLNSRQTEQEKVNRMFGSKKEMGRIIKNMKNKKKNR